MARLLEADGLIDLINTSIGSAPRLCTRSKRRCGRGLRPVHSLGHSQGGTAAGDRRGSDQDPIRRAASEQGHADLVGIVRNQIADPNSRAGGKTRPTISALPIRNQECVGRMGLNRWMGCIKPRPPVRKSATAAAPLSPLPTQARAGDRRGADRPD